MFLELKVYKQLHATDFLNMYKVEIKLKINF